jgi:hypothetical protein
MPDVGGAHNVATSAPAVDPGGVLLRVARNAPVTSPATSALGMMITTEEQPRGLSNGHFGGCRVIEHVAEPDETVDERPAAERAVCYMPERRQSVRRNAG